MYINRTMSHMHFVYIATNEGLCGRNNILHCVQSCALMLNKTCSESLCDKLSRSVVMETAVVFFHRSSYRTILLG